ncbi:transglycosylase family protein [Streptomyces humicola]|uniref:transglycosylase family protein n=1 Tax=Streptomyces humicola TaxID=2953240 RepID=UPI0022B2767A|nr:transglycosylase family protein [Streptomyces humicola]
MRPWHESRMVQVCHHRHRLRTAAATAAGALFFPLLPAAEAHADARPVWDALAACESGGNWHAHTGNGLQGGLQFSPSTWAEHGGTAYAPRADEASRREQIDIAERVLSDQGPAAWPVCSRRIGLGAEAAAAAAIDGVLGEVHAIRHSAMRWTTVIHGHRTRHHCRRLAHGGPHHKKHHGAHHKKHHGAHHKIHLKTHHKTHPRAHHKAHDKQHHNEHAPHGHHGH